MNRQRIGMYLLSLVMGLVTFYAVSFFSEKAQIRAIKVSAIDFSRLKDGMYSGEYSFKNVSSSVEITIRGRRLNGIILKDAGNSDPAAASLIFAQVLENQTLDITNLMPDSAPQKIILKAIESALLKAQ